MHGQYTNLLKWLKPTLKKMYLTCTLLSEFGPSTNMNTVFIVYWSFHQGTYDCVAVTSAISTSPPTPAAKSRISIIEFTAAHSCTWKCIVLVSYICLCRVFYLQEDACQDLSHKMFILSLEFLCRQPSCPSTSLRPERQSFPFWRFTLMLSIQQFSEWKNMLFSFLFHWVRVPFCSCAENKNSHSEARSRSSYERQVKKFKPIVPFFTNQTCLYYYQTAWVNLKIAAIQYIEEGLHSTVCLLCGVMDLGHGWLYSCREGSGETLCCSAEG